MVQTYLINLKVMNKSFIEALLTEETVGLTLMKNGLQKTSEQVKSIVKKLVNMQLILNLNAYLNYCFKFYCTTLYKQCAATTQIAKQSHKEILIVLKQNYVNVEKT